MPDVSLDEALSKALAINNHGGMFWQKFTCIHCGARQTVDEPNALYTHGECEECHGTTCIHKHGCGLLIMMHVPQEARKETVKNGHPTGG